MPSRILLINPCIHDFTAYDLWMKPLGLLYVAAALERAGYDVRLVDCLDKYHPGVLKLQGRERPRLKQFGCGKFFDQEIEKPPALRAVPRRFRRFGITPDLFRAELRHGPTPQLIFVTSMMTYWYPGVFEAIRLARETFPSAPIALGGIYATLCPDHARKHSGADFVLEGPGEAAAADLAGKIGPAPAPGPAASALSEKTRRISNVQHRMSNDEGDVHVRSDNTTRGNGQHGGPNLFGTSLASAPNKLGTPTPGAVIGGVTSSFDIQDSTFDIRRLRPPELYPAYHLMRHLDSVSVLTSRGCPFRCTYCASSTLWPGFQQREPRHVANEIEHYVQRFSVRDIAFYDDALLVNAERHILPILSLVRERGLKARFHTPNGLHARFVTPEVAHTLRASGFETVRLSLETADPARQSATGGKVSSDELAQALAHLHAAGYPRGHAEVYVMMAMPGQSYGEVVESMKLVHHAGARVRLAQYSPIPGTPDGDQCIRSLGLPPDEPLLHNKSAFPALLPDLALDRQEQLKSIAKSLNAAFGHSRCIY